MPFDASDDEVSDGKGAAEALRRERIRLDAAEEGWWKIVTAFFTPACWGRVVSILGETSNLGWRGQPRRRASSTCLNIRKQVLLELIVSVCRELECNEAMRLTEASRCSRCLRAWKVAPMTLVGYLINNDESWPKHDLTVPPANSLCNLIKSFSARGDVVMVHDQF